MITSNASVVAESTGVPIYVKGDIKAVSFVNSPYYAHGHLSAVDPYPSRYDDPVPSPVKGRVVGIRSVKAPHPKYFRADEDEKLLPIPNNADATTKILHEALARKPTPFRGLRSCGSQMAGLNTFATYICLRPWGETARGGAPDPKPESLFPKADGGLRVYGDAKRNPPRLAR
jgi:hypothetical protein